MIDPKKNLDISEIEKLLNKLSNQAYMFMVPILFVYVLLTVGGPRFFDVSIPNPGFTDIDRVVMQLEDRLYAVESELRWTRGGNSILVLALLAVPLFFRVPPRSSSRRRGEGEHA